MEIETTLDDGRTVTITLTPQLQSRLQQLRIAFRIAQETLNAIENTLPGATIVGKPTALLYLWQSGGINFNGLKDHAYDIELAVVVDGWRLYCHNYNTGITHISGTLKIW